MISGQAYQNFEENMGNMSIHALEAMQEKITQEIKSRKAVMYRDYTKDIAGLIDNIIAMGCGECIAINYTEGDDVWTWAEVADWLITEYEEKTN